MSDDRDERPLTELLAELERLASDAPADCRDLAPHVLARAVVEGDRRAEAAVLYFSGHARHLLGEDAEALRSMTLALRIVRDLADREWEARVLGGLGGVHSGYGDHAAAIECLEQSLALRREIGDRFGVAAAMHNLGVTYDEMGFMPDRARELLRAAHEVFVEVGHVEGRCGSLLHLGSLDVTRAEELAATEPAEALRLATSAAATIRDALDLAREAIGRPGLLGETLLRYARALVAAGDRAGACAAATEAAAFDGVGASLPYRLMLASVRTRIARADGDLDGGIAIAEEALDAAAGVRRPFERVDLLTQLVLAHEERGDLAAALAAHRRLHQEVLGQRDVVADVRARALSDRIALERAQVEADKARLRAERLEQVNAELAYEATHDPLTGLGNRRAYDATLAARTADPEDDVALVLADLDNFKAVNDRFTHVVGDEVLRVVARLVASAVRGTDVVARIGGEEIAVVLDRPHGVDVAAVCDRIRDAVRDHDWARVAPGLTVTVSIGAAVRRPGESAESLVGRADRLLYAAKGRGRDRVVLEPLGRA